MHTDQIEAVVAVIEHGTTTAAAAALHITPRGLRQRIKALEAELGVTLVVRDGARAPSPERVASTGTT